MSLDRITSTKVMPFNELMKDVLTVYTVAEDFTIGRTTVRQGDSVRYAGSPDRANGSVHHFYVSRANGEETKASFFNDFGIPESVRVEE